MRVTFLTPGYVWGPSGGIRVVYEYANHLASRGHSVTVVHPRKLQHPGPPPRLTMYRRVRKAAEDLRDLLAKPSTTWQPIDSQVTLLFVPTSAARYIPDGDVIFATAWTTVQSVLKYPAEKGEKCYLIQGYETWMGPKDLVDETWRSPLHKVVIAKWLLKLGKEMGCDELTYIPNAVDHARYRLTQPIENRTRQVAMVFSSVAIKGAADGIEALVIARESYPDLKAVFFGLNILRPRIPAWIEYHRNPPQGFTINEIYNRSSIFLSSSWCEGFALPPAEAAACGCAIVSADSGGIREFVDHGVTGLLSPPKHPKALADNLCLLLGNEELRIRLAKAANTHIKRFTWNRSADLLESFIGDVLQKVAVGSNSMGGGHEAVECRVNSVNSN